MKLLVPFILSLAQDVQSVMLNLHCFENEVFISR